MYSVSRLCLAGAVLALCTCGLLRAANEHHFSFGSAAELADGFAAYDASGKASSAYEWSAQPGVGGEAGRVNVPKYPPRGNVRLFSTFAMNLEQGPIHASMRFLTGGAVEPMTAGRLSLGLSPSASRWNSDLDLLETNWVADFGGPRPDTHFKIGNWGGLDIAEGITLEGGHWYGIESSWALSADGNSLHMRSELLGYGASGQGAGVSLSLLEATLSLLDFVGTDALSQPLHIVIFGYDGGNGISALDEVSVRGMIYNNGMVPEPSAFALLLGSLGALAVLRYRRRG